jgi:putative hemolysin
MRAAPEVSYINPNDSLPRRSLMRAVELMTGQPKLQRIYDRYKQTRGIDDNFWESAVNHLKIYVDFDAGRLEDLPKTGPLIIVANHPFGVVDGIAIGNIISRVRPDIKVLAHAVLGRAEPLRPFLIPITFEGESGALRANIESKRQALAHLKAGGTIIIFPAGRVSTSDKVFGDAIDSPWKPFTSKLIMQSKATVVPVYFEGQNSWLFHFVSKFSGAMREAVLMREILRQIGTEVVAHIGAPMTPDDIATINDKQLLLDHLRDAVYNLDPSCVQDARTIN